MTFNKLANGIPLHEAAAFFLKLKTAAPDETGALEGQFAAPVDQVLEHMALMVQNEMKTQYAYIVYSQSLRDLAHHAIAEELEHHADHETEHAEFLLRRMSVLGGPVEVPDIPAPPPSSDPTEIIKTLIQMEQEGIANWQALRKLVGEDNPTRFKIEEYLTREQEHLDELWQLLPHEETAAAGGTPPQAVEPAPAQEEAAPDTQAAPQAKTAGTSIERRVERLHARRPDLQKTAAAGKLANAPAPAQLPDAAMGKVPPAAPPPPALQGASAGQLPKVAARFKLALDAMGAPPGGPAPGGEEASELEQYLAEEGAAREEQTAAEDGFYRQRFTEAMQRLQAAEEQSQAAQAQVAELQAQVDAGSQQNQMALQQAQMLQQQAMQQVNAANVAATQAMQKSLASSSELLQQQQLAVNMRDAMQQLKSQLMGIVQSQLPPSTTMEAGASEQQAQAAADAEAMDMQAQAVMGGQDPGGNQAGAPAAAPDPGTAPGAAPPGKDGPGASPTASDPSSSPAEGKKTESTKSEEKPEDPAKTASDRFIGGLLGAGLGAGVTALEAKGSNDPLRAKVKKLEAAEAAGNGGFGTAMNLAQSKMRLAMGELMEKHPGKATLVGAALGAQAGAQAAPHVRSIANSLRG